MMKQLCAWFAWIFLATGAVTGCSQSIQQVSNTPTLPPPAVEPASPSNIPSSKPISGINVAAGKRVIARNGGITYCSRRIGISCLSLAFRPIGLFCFYLCNTIHPRLCIAAENK
jgi:hypothetical protein